MAKIFFRILSLLSLGLITLCLSIFLEHTAFGQNIGCIPKKASWLLPIPTNNRTSTFIGTARADDYRVPECPLPWNNTVVGLLGRDTLVGGTGADSFQFNSPSEGPDLILDFDSGTGDKILVSAKGFGGGLVEGSLSNDQFYSAASNENVVETVSASNRFTYNTKTGHLYYNADGSKGGSVLLAVLRDLKVDTSVPPLTSSDILVIR